MAQAGYNGYGTNSDKDRLSQAQNQVNFYNFSKQDRDASYIFSFQRLCMIKNAILITGNK